MESPPSESSTTRTCWRTNRPSSTGTSWRKTSRHTGRHKLVGLPVRMSRTPGTPKQLFAELGEHTAEVMRELGYDEAAIETVESHRAPPF